MNESNATSRTTAYKLLSLLAVCGTDGEASLVTEGTAGCADATSDALLSGMATVSGAVTSEDSTAFDGPVVASIVLRLEIEAEWAGFKEDSSNIGWARLGSDPRGMLLMLLLTRCARDIAGGDSTFRTSKLRRFSEDFWRCIA